MGSAVAPREREVEEDNSQDIHSKDLEGRNRQAFALVRRMLRDSIVFPMDVVVARGIVHDTQMN